MLEEEKFVLDINYYRKNRKDFIRFLDENTVVLNFINAELVTDKVTIALRKEDIANPRIINDKVVMVSGDVFKITLGYLEIPFSFKTVKLEEYGVQKVSSKPVIYVFTKKIDNNRYYIKAYMREYKAMPKMYYIMERNECRTLLPFTVKLRVCI